MKVKLDVKYLTKKIHGDQNAMVCVSCDLMRSVCVNPVRIVIMGVVVLTMVHVPWDCDGGACFDDCDPIALLTMVHDSWFFVVGSSILTRVSESVVSWFLI